MRHCHLTLRLTYDIEPSRDNPMGLDEFRPIYMYKIITKILANRMKCVLPKVIDFSQSSFLKGRGYWTISL